MPSGSGQQAFLLSLFDKDPGVIAPPQLTLGTVKYGPTRDIYLWDMHALAERIGNRGTGAETGYWTVPSEDDFWCKAWLSSFRDDAGNPYHQLETPFTLSPFNKKVADQHNYSGSLGMSPLMGGGLPEFRVPETAQAELIIRQATLFPGLPYLITSSIPDHKHYGPVFFNSIRYHVDGSGTLGTVDIEARWRGGKIFCNKPKQAIIPDLFGEEDDFIPYRAASLMDCLALQGSWNNIDEFLADPLVITHIKTEIDDPQERLIEMSLEMSQRVDFTVTCPKPGYKDEQGPRYITISEREVSGELSYYSRTSEVIIPQNEGAAFTMYFGGSFFFSMPQIEWQFPQIEIIPGVGFYHTYRFLARAAENAPVLFGSEFMVGNNG